ncbi:hypothetical protein LJ725_22220 [Reyranella aquatilis]|uniref:Uncharacterized protein n=1 Tax=Reyranella aquatilis TaxID=2035356 RepID=A0ABS8L1M9_9HYPH|nr:hypothetical protein [Reyranella aquatilis]MCC8431701.1 hypothetical protein [Reyranella aquatilis]
MMTFSSRFGVACSTTAIMPARIIAGLFKLLRRPHIVGCVDGPSRGRLHGWAFDRRNPLQRLTVALQNPGGRRFVTLADRYRADVQRAGMGDGHCGFSLPIPASGEAAAVYVLQGRSTVELPPASIVAPAGSGAQKHRAASYELQIDSLFPGRISGWALDTARPELRRNLQLYCNGRFIGRQRATLYRAEVVDGRRDGYHGFCFPLPAGQITSLTIEDVALDASFVARL